MNVFSIVSTVILMLLAVFALVQPLVAVSTHNGRNKGNARLSLLIAVSALILAIGLYSVIGRPGVPSFSPRTDPAKSLSTTPQAATIQTDAVAPVGSLLAGLEERLTENPDDAKGWLLLAKSYQHLGQTDKARSAYEQATALGQTDAAFVELLDAPSASTPADNVIEIRGRVSLSESVMSQVNKSDTVFVFAKAVHGPQMPLAVVRRPVADLPFEFTLSDAQSMVEGSGISSVESVVVTAKISAPGNALSTNLALEIKSEPIATASAPYLDLLIGSINQNN